MRLMVRVTVARRIPVLLAIAGLALAGLLPRTHVHSEALDGDGHRDVVHRHGSLHGLDYRTPDPSHGHSQTDDDAPVWVDGAVAIESATAPAISPLVAVLTAALLPAPIVAYARVGTFE